MPDSIGMTGLGDRARATNATASPSTSRPTLNLMAPPTDPLATQSILAFAADNSTGVALGGPGGPGRASWAGGRAGRAGRQRRGAQTRPAGAAPSADSIARTSARAESAVNSTATRAAGPPAGSRKSMLSV